MENFWDYHGIFFIIFMFFFPRLTLLFSSVPFGGLLWWLGWLFAPRLLVAILATNMYWQVNTVLVIITWFWALSGESLEKGSGGFYFKKKRNSNKMKVVN